MTLLEQLRDALTDLNNHGGKAAVGFDPRDLLRSSLDRIEALEKALRDTVRVIRKMPSPCPGQPMGPSEIAAVVNTARAALAQGSGK